MSDIKAVINCCIKLLSYKITIAPYSFSMLTYLLALGVLGIVVWFISRLFD